MTWHLSQPRQRRPVIAGVLVALLVLPAGVAAQASVLVEGRVTSVTGAVIQNAVVALQGQGSVLTDEEGGFRFPGVTPGEYALRAEAFGYVTLSQTIRVVERVSIIVELDIAPFEMDSLVVAPDRIEMKGQVRDDERDVVLRGADIRTNQGHDEQTNNGGRFDIEVWEGAPVMVQIRAFGYLPMDSLIVPQPDSSYSFRLAEDPLVERMIQTEITRIEERAGGRLAVSMRPLNRDDLARWRGATLLELLQSAYPYQGRRIRCVVVNERSLTPESAGGVLETTLARDVERIEFLFGGGMLRVYTREFMRTMLGSGIELRRATYADMAEPPLCT